MKEGRESSQDSKYMNLRNSKQFGRMVEEPVAELVGKHSFDLRCRGSLNQSVENDNVLGL
jgi:hypothetical protein